MPDFNLTVKKKICFFHPLDRPGVGPSVKKLLHEYNIAASSVSGTGPKGNLIKG